MNVFELSAKLGVDASEFESGLASAANKVASFGQSIANIGQKIAGITTSFVNAASSTADYGDNIDKMSQKIGISAQAYQEWDAVMQHCGTSVDVMQTGMKTLSTAVQNGSSNAVEAFKTLGLSMEQVAGMSQEELFSAVIYRLQQMESGTERTALATTLLGRSATEMGALLNMSAAETQEMIATVHSLNGVMSDEAVKASAQYKDSLQNMNTAISGFKNNLMANFLPAMSTVMDGLAKIFSGDSGGGLALVRQGITNLSKSISEVLPTFVQLGSQIIQGLAQAIMQNAPTLLQSGYGIITTLINGLSQSLPMILNYVPYLMQMFCYALEQNLDPIMNAVSQCAVIVVNSLINNLPKILESLGDVVWQLIKSIFTGETVQIQPVMMEFGNGMSQSMAQGFSTGASTYIPQACSATITTFQASMQQFSTAAEQVGGAGGSGFSEGYGRQAKTGVDAANAQIQSSMNTELAAIASTAQTAGTQTAQAYGQGLYTIDSASESAMQSVASTFAASCTSINSSMASVDSTTLGHLNSMVNHFVNAGNSFASAMQSSGAAMVSAISSAMAQMGSAMSAQLNSVLSAITSFGNTAVSQFRTIGSQIVQGLISGISSGQSALTQTINSLVSSTVNQAKAGLEIHSPSRVFRDQVGAQISAGIAAGIDANAIAPLQSINALNSNMVNAAGNGNGGIMGRLGSIAGMLEEYLPNMGGDTYLDGDRISEKLIGRMDRMLGQRTVRVQRGGAR